ncbi:MAG: peptide chain release factor N(5)-glutamine methyltransferase, partial [Methylococcales bacterium]|nr:peptide chain release factor N(5)-glutamine methyltransferase [Methylococcales bacterium]
KPRSHLRAWPEKILSKQAYNQFLSLLSQRQQGIPIAYITGSREFWSRDFKVTTDVLIPRPDTELLIELSLELINNKTQTHILDLGTGSGIIAITLAAERPELKFMATDLSEPALKIAKENAASHQIKNIRFIQSNWLEQIPPSQFDLIISNPPYIAVNDSHLSQGDVRFEPENALIADQDGLKDIKNICHQALDYLAPNGTLLIEHGFEQKIAVQAIFKTFAYSNVKTHNDLSENPRVTTGQWQL